MGKKYSAARLLMLAIVLSLSIFNISAFGFTSYAKSIANAAVRREVLGFSIHEVYGNHFKANPYSDDVFLSSAYKNTGYIAVKNDTKDRLLINLQHGDDKTVVYTANPGITYCLLTQGDGTYDIVCGRKGEKALLSDQVKTTVSEDDEIYTYPSSYAMFEPDSKIMALCSTFPSDPEEYMNAVCEYLSKHGHYTTEGDRLETWYVPCPDDFVDDFRGDCFDFASYVTAAFRMRGIPCKLVVGEFDKEGHAWVEVKSPFTGNLGGYPMTKGEWCIVDPTVFVSSDLAYNAGTVFVGAYHDKNKDKYKANYCY